MEEQQAYDDCIKRLSRREYSQQELAMKLSQRGFSGDVIADCLARLIADNYQSDERFAEMFCRTRVSQRHGERKIRYELKQNGVDEWLINQQIPLYQELFLENAVYLIERKLSNEQRQEGRCDRKTKDKITRFLLTKGYDYQLISQAFYQVFNGAG